MCIEAVCVVSVAIDVGDAGADPASEFESVSESFSQTISGDQTRSGRERTTSGGARSASRCLTGKPSVSSDHGHESLTERP